MEKATNFPIAKVQPQGVANLSLALLMKVLLIKKACSRILTCYLIQSNLLKYKFIKPPPMMSFWEIYGFFKAVILKSNSE